VYDALVAIPSNRGCCPTATRDLRIPRGLAGRNPLKSGLLSYHTYCCACRRYIWSQSPQIGAAVLPVSLVERMLIEHPVAIPSNRGCCPTGKWYWGRKGVRDVSQSPQIGAAVLPCRRVHSGRDGMWSQSPQIGAAVLPDPSDVLGYMVPDCRNPLKSGLLSYLTTAPAAVQAALLRRNPLKSGLLSYPSSGST